MTAALHPEVRRIIDSSTVEGALQLAAAAALAPSAVFNEEAWLTVAAAADSAALTNPRWLALCIFAHEQRTGDAGVVQALVKRSRLLAVRGADPDEAFRDPTLLFDGVRRFVAGDSAQAALLNFHQAMDGVFGAERHSAEWSSARLRFLDGRRLRELGTALRSVANAGIAVPSDLAEWLLWADVREVDGKVVV